MLASEEEKHQPFKRQRSDRAIIKDASFSKVMESTRGNYKNKDLVEDDPFKEITDQIVKIEPKKQPKMTRDEIQEKAKQYNEEIERMIRAPEEHTPEEIIAKAAEARLQVSELSNKERRRLVALRELSKIAIDEERVFKSDTELKQEEAVSVPKPQEVERAVVITPVSDEL